VDAVEILLREIYWMEVDMIPKASASLLLYPAARPSLSCYSLKMKLADCNRPIYMELDALRACN